MESVEPLPEDPSPRTRRPRPVRAKAPRRDSGAPSRGGSRWPFWVAAALVAIALVAAGAVWFRSAADRAAGVVPLAPPSAESTSPLSFAGSFPAATDPPLSGPFGIAVLDGRVFVAESLAGVVREFALDGRRVRSIKVPRPSADATAYPADIALVDAGKKLAVVDSAGARVLLLPVDGNASRPVIVGARDARTAPGQPTAVAAVPEGVAIADAKARLVRVYRLDGTFVRDLGETLAPRLGFVGGMAFKAGRLYVSDSNQGRVVVLDVATGAAALLWPERLRLPRGIADAAGVFAVAETFGPALSLHAPDGASVARIDAETPGLEEAGKLRLPKSVAWSGPSSRLYVSDAGDGRVKVYNYVPSKDR